MTQTYQKTEKHKEHPATLEHVKSITKHLRSHPLHAVQALQHLRLQFNHPRSSRHGESRADTAAPHASTSPARGEPGWLPAAPGELFQGRCAAGSRQRAAAPLRCRGAEPAGAGSARPPARAGPAAPPLRKGTGGAPAAAPSPPSPPAISPSGRQKCLSGVMELQRGPAAWRSHGLVLGMPPLKLLPFHNEGWVGQMSAPVGGPRSKGCRPHPGSDGDGLKVSRKKSVQPVLEMGRMPFTLPSVVGSPSGQGRLPLCSPFPALTAACK